MRFSLETSLVLLPLVSQAAVVSIPRPRLSLRREDLSEFRGGRGNGGRSDNKGGTNDIVNNAANGAFSAVASNNTIATNSDDSGDPQKSLTLDPRVIGKGFANDGQDVPAAGQVASLTSTNNFINFCLTVSGLPITGGQQITTGSCNPAPIGTIPSFDNMPSAKFTFPKNGGTVTANQSFTIQMNIQNLATGNFVNTDENYFAAPQQLNTQGQIIGHSHVVVETLSSIDQTTVTDPRNFAFFKSMKDAAVNGVLIADVTSGLPAGAYRLCSINTCANHQPAIVPVAQHGSLDDCIYFSATADGQPATGVVNLAAFPKAPAADTPPTTFVARAGKTSKTTVSIPRPPLSLRREDFNNEFKGRRGNGGRSDNKGGTNDIANNAANGPLSAVASNNAIATSSDGSVDPQTSLTLDPRVIANGFANDGQDVPVAGQVASLTSTNNFINFCLTVPNLPITNGQQIKTGSCNPAPIGAIPSIDNMPSAKFTFPKNGGTVTANQSFTIRMNIKNLATGNSVNADENYFAAPQQLDAQGQIIGHSHVVVETLSSIDQTTATDPRNFAFFKELKDAAVTDVLTAEVTAGLPPGAYRLCSINTCANHQPVIVAVVRHGFLDDCIYFTATEDDQSVSGAADVAVFANATAADTESATSVAGAAKTSAAEAATTSASAKSTKFSKNRRYRLSQF